MNEQRDPYRDGAELRKQASLAARDHDRNTTYVAPRVVYGPCGECAEGQCDGCEMCLYFENLK